MYWWCLDNVLYPSRLLLLMCVTWHLYHVYYPCWWYSPRCNCPQSPVIMRSVSSLTVIICHQGPAHHMLISSHTEKWLSPIMVIGLGENTMNAKKKVLHPSFSIYFDVHIHIKTNYFQRERDEICVYQKKQKRPFSNEYLGSRGEEQGCEWRHQSWWEQ